MKKPRRRDRGFSVFAQRMEDAYRSALHGHPQDNHTLWTPVNGNCSQKWMLSEMTATSSSKKMAASRASVRVMFMGLVTSFR